MPGIDQLIFQWQEFTDHTDIQNNQLQELEFWRPLHISNVQSSARQLLYKGWQIPRLVGFEEVCRTTTTGDIRNGCRAHQEINCFTNGPGILRPTREGGGGYGSPLAGRPT